MSLFLINIRFQIAAVCFLAIIIFSYIRMKKLELYSTRCFNCMLVICAVNMVFDISTVYTITHMDTVTAWVNDLCHRLFILSLVLMMVSLYFYIEAIGQHQKRMSIQRTVFRLIPFFIALVLIIIGKIQYYVGEDGAYSFGTLSAVIYLIIINYMIIIFVRTFQFRHIIRKESILSIRLGMLIWVIAAVVQYLNPTWLISGLASVLLVFFMYLAFQNPKELQDLDSGAFNERALNYALTERLAAGKPVFVVGVLMKDIAELYSLLGTGTGRQLISEITSDLVQVSGTKIYRTDQSYNMLFANRKEITEHLSQIIECFEQERDMNGTKVGLTVSVYILECPKYAASIEAWNELDNFLTKVYLPASHEKQVFFVDEEICKKHQRRTAVSSLVMEALRNDGLEVFYQPIFDVKSGHFSSAEALVRMKNTGELGFVSPEEFIPMAENNGMIGELGAIVFQKVCEFGRDYQLPERGVHYIEVNLSGIQVVDENICSQLNGIMSQYGTDPSFINLEITETASVEFKDILRDNMNSLRKMGCSFSMDDFGTGYSNIAQIAMVHYDLIKLDKSLIWPCFEDADPKKARMILDSIVGLIHKMGIKIVAEGVETEEQADFLIQLGVEYLQGYYFCRPVRGEDYLAFLEKKA